MDCWTEGCSPEHEGLSPERPSPRSSSDVGFVSRVRSPDAGDSVVLGGSLSFIITTIFIFL